MTSAGPNKKKPFSPLTVSEKLELIESRRQKQMKKSEPKTIKVTIYTEVPKNYTGIAEYPDGGKTWYLNGKRHREDGPASITSSGTKFWYLNDKYCSESEWKELLKQMEKSTLKIYESIFEDASFKQELKEKHNAEVRKQVHDGFVVYSYHDIDSGKLKNISLGRGDFKCGIIRDNKVEIDTESASTISFYKDSGLPCAFLMADEETGKFVTEWKGENSSWFYDDKTSWENGEWSKINFHKTTGAVVGDLSQEIKDFINNLDVSNSVKSVAEQAETKQNTLEEINIWSLKDVPVGFTGIANFSEGSKHWFLNGKCHREDGPAIEFANGRREWWLNGQCHRVDGPAVEWPDGSKFWFLNGLRHRVDGPACEYADGSREWWLNNKSYSEADWKVAVEKLKAERGSVLQVLKLRAGHTVPENFTGVINWDTGNKTWYLNGKLHRKDGPAVEYADGTKAWYLNGLNHREDGPAIEYANGEKFWWLNGVRHRENGPACEMSDGRKSWFLNGLRHREDGPAFEYADGSKEWWLNGREYSEEKWKIAVEKLKNPEVEKKENIMDNKPETEQEEVLEPAILKVKTEEQIPDDYVGIVEFPDGEKQWRKGMIIHREDGPAVIWANGTKEWVINGEYHRVDGPAVEYSDGSKEWYLNGKRHRVDGPAVDSRFGAMKKWFLNDQLHREDGPAIEKGNKYKAWYLNGVRYSKKQWLVELEKLKKEREKPTLESLKEKFKDNSTPLGEVFNDFIYDRYFDISISEDGKRVIVADKQCHEVSELYSYAEYSTADGSLIEGRYYSSKGERLTLADSLRALQTFREETLGIEGFKEKVLEYHGFKDGEYRIHNNSFVAKDKKIYVYWIQEDKINYFFTLYDNKGKLIHEKDYKRSKTNLEILGSNLREDVLSLETEGCLSNNEWRAAHFSADGKYHSLTGPAVIRHGSRSKNKQNEIYCCEYAINGVFMPKEVWFERAYDLTKDKQGLSFEEWKAKIEPTLPVVNVKEEALAVIEKPKVDTSAFAAVKKTIKSDAREVAKRIAVKRIIKFAAEFIANQFKSQKAAFKSIEEFLRSDRGMILLQLTAGTILPQFKSSFPEKYHALYEEVCDELRIQAEVGLADEFIDVLVPAIKEQIHLVSFHNSSSEDIKVRVDSSVVETSCLETEEKKNLPEETGQPFSEDLPVSKLEPLASNRA